MTSSSNIQRFSKQLYFYSIFGSRCVEQIYQLKALQDQIIAQGLDANQFLLPPKIKEDSDRSTITLTWIYPESSKKIFGFSSPLIESENTESVCITDSTMKMGMTAVGLEHQLERSRPVPEQLIIEDEALSEETTSQQNPVYSEHLTTNETFSTRTARRLIKSPWRLPIIERASPQKSGRKRKLSNNFEINMASLPSFDDIHEFERVDDQNEACSSSKKTKSSSTSRCSWSKTSTISKNKQIQTYQDVDVEQRTQTYKNPPKNKNLPKPKDVGLKLLLEEELYQGFQLEKQYKDIFHNFAIRDPFYKTDKDLTIEEHASYYNPDSCTTLRKLGDRKSEFKIDQTVKILDFPAASWTPAKIFNIEGNLVELKFNKDTFINNIKKNVKNSKHWDFKYFKNTLVTNIYNPFILTEKEFKARHGNVEKNNGNLGLLLSDLKIDDFVLFDDKPVKITKISINEQSAIGAVGKFVDGNTVNIPKPNKLNIIPNEPILEDFVGYATRDLAYMRPENFSTFENFSNFGKRFIDRSVKSSVLPTSKYHKIDFKPNQKCYSFDFGGRWEQAKISQVCYKTKSILLTYPRPGNDTKPWSIWVGFDNPHLRELTWFLDVKLLSQDYENEPYSIRKIKVESIDIDTSTSNEPDNIDNQDDTCTTLEQGKETSAKQVQQTKNILIKYMAENGYKINGKVLARYRTDKEFYPAFIKEINYNDSIMHNTYMLTFTNGMVQNTRNIEKNIIKNPSRQEWDEATRFANNKFEGNITLPLFFNEEQGVGVKTENTI